jgi:aarF domain-containing kinase
VVKVQYPGVAQSIELDLGNLSMLVRMTGLAPKGLSIENVIQVGQDELKVECNYLNELANQESFKSLVDSEPILRENEFTVPDVFEDLTTKQVLTTAFSHGGTIDKLSHLDQEEQNRIGRTILYLTMQELFEWRLMQTGKL